MSAHRVRYPFLRCKAEVFDGVDSMVEIESWKPGTEYDNSANADYWQGEPIRWADGVGEMVLTEVGRYKPGKYPERVFYTRAWVNPDGVAFGKPALRIATANKFKRLCTGYAYPFNVDRAEAA